MQKPMGERKHLVILEKDESEAVLRALCFDCGLELDNPTEHHPRAFCELRKLGHDPRKIVLAAFVGVPRDQLPEGVRRVRPAESGDRAGAGG